MWKVPQVIFLLFRLKIPVWKEIQWREIFAIKIRMQFRFANLYQIYSHDSFEKVWHTWKNSFFVHSFTYSVNLQLLNPIVVDCITFKKITFFHEKKIEWIPCDFSHKMESR